MAVWLNIIGIGEDGMEGLAPPAIKALQNADVIIGGDRHHGLAPEFGKKRIRWPEPFWKVVGTIGEHKGQQVVLLVTGDPLWYSAGSSIANSWPKEEIRFHPQISAFQLACIRMHWPVASVEKVTVHGRPVEQIIPWFLPRARIAVLTAGSEAPGQIARLLTENGFGPSRMTVLGALGGPHETMNENSAERWAKNDPTAEIPKFHVLCIECIPASGANLLRKSPGLPDAVFESDGNITKCELRALTIAALAPSRGALLWDIGSGNGSVAIEWMRLASDAAAVGIEPNASRRETALRNAKKLGAPKLQLIDGQAPEAMEDLPDPDAVFIGGGLGEAVIIAALGRLKPFGRLVANGVTLESEKLLIESHSRFGGELVRIAISRAGPIGEKRGWRPLRPVTQWRYNK